LAFLEGKNKLDLKENDPLENKLKTLIDQGFDAKKAYRMLRKFSGDLEKTVEKLNQKKNEKKSLSLEKKYQQELKFFIGQGYYNTRKVLKALEENEGNQDKTLKFLKE
jgi:hypothetical protein